MSARTAGRLLLLSSIWGASFMFIKVGVEGMHASLVVLGRIGTGAVVVLAWCIIGRRPLPRRRAEWSHASFMAFFGNVIPFMLITLGEKTISSALASVLNATTPLLTALVAVFFIRTERLTLRRAAGILVGLAGVAEIVVPGARLGGGKLTGMLLVIAASAAYGVSASFAKRYLRTEPISAAAAQLLVATLGAAILAGSLARHAPFVLTVPRALAVLTLGMLGTGFAWVIYLRLIAEAGATTASFVTYLVPFFSIVIGWLVLHETLRWNVYLGGTVIIAGIWIAEGRSRTSYVLEEHA